MGEYKMKADHVLKPIIKYRKREIRHRVLKLPYIWWVFTIFLVAAGLLILAYFTYHCHPWLSGVLVSTSCGCFTGITFYFLVNVRANQERQLQKEYAALKQTFDILNSIINCGSYYRLYRKMWVPKRNVFDDGYEIRSALGELECARNAIVRSVYDTVEDIGFDPMDLDNINSYRDKIDTAESEKDMEKALIWIAKELTPAADKIQMLLSEREDQISFIGNRFI